MLCAYQHESDESNHTTINITIIAFDGIQQTIRRIKNDKLSHKDKLWSDDYYDYHIPLSSSSSPINSLGLLGVIPL